MGISTEEQEKYFEQEYERLMTIPDEETIVLNIPPEEAIAEVTRMESIIEQDKQELLDSDVEEELIESYRSRAGAFLYSIVKSQTISSGTLSTNEEWKQLKKESSDLRKDLGYHFRWAFRKDPKLLETVDRILADRVDRNLALDMLTLSKLGNKNRDSLGRLKRFNFEQLDRAAELYILISDFLARSEISPDEEADMTDVVNKSWTHLKKALDEIYEGGKYTFPEGTERHDLYYSDYYKRHGTPDGKQRAASKAVITSYTIVDETEEEQPVDA
jgi:hypothetical protein